MFFELGDHLGSTSVVLDKATGELVERSTYQAYGGTESDYRPERWKSFREDYRFTGKEEDVEVGLVYFGKRFLNPLLNRWISADPLAIHGLGADPNLYAYVSGRVLQSVDPFGLERVGPQAATDPTYDDAVRLAKGAWNFLVEVASSRASMDLNERRAASHAAYFNGASRTDTHVLKDVQANGLGRYKFEGKTPKEQKELEGMETAISVATLAPALVSGGAAAVGAIRRSASKAKSTVQIARGLAKLEKETDAVVDTLAGAGSRGVTKPAVSNCFVAGTLVLTSHGYRAIEAIHAGEYVLAQPDEGDESAEAAWRQVQQTFVRHAEAVDLTLVADSGAAVMIGTTRGHPLWLADRGWTQVGDLAPGDRVWSRQRGWLRVRSVHERPEQEPVYNLHVAEDRTYFVTTVDVWVHNTSPGSSATPKLPPYDGKTTHGVLRLSEGGDDIPLSSGKKVLPNYEGSGHVEGKAALEIRARSSSGGTVWHNNTNGTCGYCNSHTATLLPEGAKLNVVPPANAVANNSRAVAAPKQYTGNSRPIKSPPKQQ